MVLLAAAVISIRIESTGTLCRDSFENIKFQCLIRCVLLVLYALLVCVMPNLRFVRVLMQIC